MQFLGPIPEPVKLPPKWKCAKDKYGRPYYYHVKIRKSQWIPPSLTETPVVEEAECKSNILTDSTVFSNMILLSFRVFSFFLNIVTFLEFRVIGQKGSAFKRNMSSEFGSCHIEKMRNFSRSARNCMGLFQ